MKYLRVWQVSLKTTYCKSSIWAKAKNKDDDFPSPINLSPRVTVWIEEEIDEWIKKMKKSAKNG